MNAMFSINSNTIKVYGKINKLKNGNTHGVDLQSDRVSFPVSICSVSGSNLRVFSTIGMTGRLWYKIKLDRAVISS